MSGLWSRVAASWRRWRAEPAPPEDRPGPPGAYGKQALKETLERKRRNDLVRRAELAQLREIRRRKRHAAEAVAHDAGFFQSSLLSYTGEQSQTLQKIDAVEAQFSRDWWRGRLGGAGVRGAAPTAASDALPASPVSSLAYASTQPVTHGLVSSTLATGGEPASADFEASRMAAARIDPLSPADLWPAAPTVSSQAATAVAPKAADQPVAPSWTADAVLEEAALRYANGDDAGAYARLLGALREQPQSPQAALWRSALRDLDALAAAGLLRTAGQADAGAWDWRCPARLDPAALQELANTLDVAVADPARMLALDWSALRSVAAEAATPLADLLQGCCGRAQPLRLGASQTLETLLREQTPSADDRVPESLWRARLALLRLLGQQDAFELAALGFCISPGVALSVWAAPARPAQTLLEPPRPHPPPP
ncbi:MAG: hypothetical protein FGM55_03035, partial [Rhodoferax sp.]|nr:hypothetical protein [Rhodoferax sp.]